MTDVAERSYAPPEFRAAKVADVHYAKRQIDVLAVPYDVEAHIYEPARDYVESFAPGAFNGAQHRLTGRNRITVNREHDAGRPVGKVVALHVDRSDGLVAELRLTAGVPLADETLLFAADDVLGASISFAPMNDRSIEWSRDRRSRRVVSAYLNHIALVTEPAYAEAGVLAVRAETAPPPSDTPWLDEIRLQRLQARFTIPG